MMCLTWNLGREQNWGMKNSHIAFWIAAVGVAIFFYNIQQIKAVENDALAWKAQVQASNNPGASSYIKAFIDGLTLGATSGGDVFAEQHKQDAMFQQLEVTRLQLVKRYQDAVDYRNWGLGIGVAGCVAGFLLKKKSA
jgi:hypothetical protein